MNFALSNAVDLPGERLMFTHPSQDYKSKFNIFDGQMVAAEMMTKGKVNKT